MGPDRYHHGNLRAALVDAATDLALQGGPGAVVVREAARVVGVSHNAAYRHFASREALLDAVADRGLARLAGSMEDALAEQPPSGDPVEDAWGRLRAVGLGYLRFALGQPGLFRTAFSVLGDPREVPHRIEGRGPAGTDAYEQLSACIDHLTALGELPPERRAMSELVAWSGVHGLASLLLDGPLRGTPTVVAEEILGRLCGVLRSGL